MLAPQHNEKKQDNGNSGHIILTLRVRNHPGVMSHVCGLFARRAYNLEGILCMPVGDTKESMMWLSVGADSVLDQVIKQLTKLHDVLEVRQQGVDREHFHELERFFSAA